MTVDVRIISATHRDLKAEIAAGTFREDLYYRLDVVALTIPALSQRREDIPLLTNYFLSMFSEKYNKNINGFAPEAMEMLVSASWPGNVRQLMNVVERCVALSTAPLISPVLGMTRCTMKKSISYPSKMRARALKEIIWYVC